MTLGFTEICSWPFIKLILVDSLLRCTYRIPKVSWTFNRKTARQTLCQAFRRNNKAKTKRSNDVATEYESNWHSILQSDDFKSLIALSRSWCRMKRSSFHSIKSSGTVLNWQFHFVLNVLILSPFYLFSSFATYDSYSLKYTAASNILCTSGHLIRLLPKHISNGFNSILSFRLAQQKLSNTNMGHSPENRNK